MRDEFYRNVLRVIIIISVLFILINNWGCAVNPNYIEREEVTKVVATGYGLTSQESSDHAFGEALSKAFGVKVNSNKTVENRTLTQDQVNVTDAERDSRIKSYKILEQSEKDGIYTTKIMTIVSVTHLTDISPQRKMVREEWNQLVGSTNPVVGIAQVGMKVSGEVKNYWVQWFGKPKE